MKSNETVVIIGHGPSGIGSGLGEKIDAYDNVIRFTERQGQDPKDFGTKIDYLVTSSRNHGEVINEKVFPAKRTWVFMRPIEEREEQRKFFETRLEGYRPDVVFEVWPWHYRFRDLGADGYIDPRMGAPGLIPSFTQGTAAVIMACERINPKRIDLVGFDNVLAGNREGYTDTLTIFRKGPPRPSSHDLRVERILLDELKEHYNVEIGPLNAKDSVL